MNRTRPSPSKLSDVARMAGVGNTTVSRAINGGVSVSPDTLSRVNAAIEALGYRPNRAARTLKGGRSGTIGMIMPSISDMFFSRCAEAIEIVARQQGSLLIVMASHDQEDLEIENLHQLILHRIDGLILASAAPESARLRKELVRSNIPIVGLDRPLRKFHLPSVMSENIQGARMATKHLLWHGSPNVLCMYVKPELFTIQERLRGYSDAMRSAGLRAQLVPVESCADAVAALRRYLKRSRCPTAVFAANNLTARFVWEALRTLDLRVPEQISLLCFDDFELADTLTPPMSVVQQPVEALGRSAAELLFQRMSQTTRDARKPSNDPLRLPTRLIVRQSCGCPPILAIP